MRYFSFKKIIILLFILLIVTTSIVGQNNNEQIKLPVLNNHKFVVNPYTKSPFIKTYFRNSIGAGVALDLNVPILIIDGEPLFGLRGDLTFLALDFEYQYAVNNWLAVFGKVGMTSRFGTEPQALIAQGINATYGFELGWMFKIFETRNLQLSATTNLWSQSGTVFNFYDFIQNIIENDGLEPNNQLIFSKDYIQGGGGLRIAWVASELIGINGLSEFAFGESLDNSGSKIFYNIAVSVDLDLKKVSSIPIGFAFGFTANTFLSSNDGSIDRKATSTFLRTSYTGRDDILISLDVTWNKIPIRQSNQTLNGMTSLVSVEYYF